MATSHNVNQEYWRPVQNQHADEGTCPRCGTELVLGGRFCHACGAPREAAVEVEDAGRLNVLQEFRESIGLTTASIVAFVIGVLCAIAALVTGFMYTANTVLDWQAVQVWRIQWLLGALVAFAAGLFLKRSR